MGTANYVSWNPFEWQTYSTLVLRQRYGNGLVPVPDKSGGDGGLDAYVRSGYAWQMYACENEPLQPGIRYKLQRGKVTNDLKKLHDYADRITAILGDTTLTEWVLMTPYHESSDLVVHCNNKAAEVRKWNLPFIADTFQVSVHTLQDYAPEHQALQAAGVLPDEISSTVVLPAFDLSGQAFSQATSPLIAVMDKKLEKIAPSPQARSYLRGEMLSSKVAGDELLSRYDERVPDVAAALRHEISLAKRKMLMSQAQTANLPNQLDSVRADIVARLRDVAANLRISNAEVAADSAIVSWLQECSMDFIGSDAP